MTNNKWHALIDYLHDVAFEAKHSPASAINYFDMTVQQRSLIFESMAQIKAFESDIIAYVINDGILHISEHEYDICHDKLHIDGTVMHEYGHSHDCDVIFCTKNKLLGVYICLCHRYNCILPVQSHKSKPQP